MINNFKKFLNNLLNKFFNLMGYFCIPSNLKVLLFLLFGLQTLNLQEIFQLSFYFFPESFKALMLFNIKNIELISNYLFQMGILGVMTTFFVGGLLSLFEKSVFFIFFNCLTLLIMKVIFLFFSIYSLILFYKHLGFIHFICLISLVFIFFSLFHLEILFFIKGFLIFTINFLSFKFKKYLSSKKVLCSKGGLIVLGGLVKMEEVDSGKGLFFKILKSLLFLLSLSLLGCLVLLSFDFNLKEVLEFILKSVNLVYVYFICWKLSYSSLMMYPMVMSTYLMLFMGKHSDKPNLSPSEKDYFIFYLLMSSFMSSFFLVFKFVWEGSFWLSFSVYPSYFLFLLFGYIVLSVFNHKKNLMPMFWMNIIFGSLLFLGVFVMLQSALVVSYSFNFESMKSAFILWDEFLNSWGSAVNMSDISSLDIESNYLIKNGKLPTHWPKEGNPISEYYFDFLWGATMDPKTSEQLALFSELNSKSLNLNIKVKMLY